ncbi:MAG TPA: MFS transporter [Steroidobacteraceae bacterium]|nr:MFS transporter [Steroidobacteraceae bacterium]
MNSDSELPGRPRRAGGWLDALRVYGQPRMLSMLALGFSSGLPFMLIYSTLSAWLRQSGIERATIGMLSWVGLVYTLKFLWAPVIDRLRLPVIGRLLGQRRSWMLLAQVGIASALMALSVSDPRTQVARMAVLALLLAFAAATQDVAIDAWRIESAPMREQGAMAAAYQLGYRLAILVGQAGALWIAADLGWARSYTTMAALVGVGVLATLLVREPERIAPLLSVLTEQRVVDWLARRAHWPHSLRHAGAWFLGAVLCPMLDFFARYGAPLGLLIFAFIGTYRLTDYTMGSMANPFYLDLGFTLKQIAAIAKIYGTVLSVVGILVGGLAVAKLGRTRSLVLGSALVIISNLSYGILAARGQPSLAGLASVISLDNFAQGVHGTALIAFMSSLTSAAYTATQYAVLSSLYALPGKLLMGTSGIVVDHIGYPPFFLYTAALSIPALVLLYLLSRRADFVPLRASAAA